MIRFTLLFVAAMFVITGCNDTALEPMTEGGTSLSGNAWVLPETTAKHGTTPQVSEPNSMGKPLSVLEFDELPFQPVDGLSIEDVTFAFEVGGAPSPDARYNAGGPSPGPFVQCPCMEGTTAGTLTITFEKPSQIVEFGVALSTLDDLSPGFTVDVIGPSGMSRNVIGVDTSPAPDFSGALFAYGKNAVKQLVITFDGRASRFAIDNLKYHQAPR